MFTVLLGYLGYLARGVAIGFAIAAPVGPIGVLCIRRTLADGRRVGFVTGLGAATADGFYGAVAAFGLTAVSSLLIEFRLYIHLVGAIFLAWLGLRSLLARPADPGVKPLGEESAKGQDATRFSLLGAYTSTVGLTLTNPATIISFAAVFAGLGLAGARAGYGASAATVAGVLLGSALWWFLLSGMVTLFRARFTPRALRWVNVASGLILIGFAVLALASL